MLFRALALVEVNRLGPVGDFESHFVCEELGHGFVATVEFGELSAPDGYRFVILSEDAIMVFAARHAAVLADFALDQRWDSGTEHGEEQHQVPRVLVVQVSVVVAKEFHLFPSLET